MQSALSIPGFAGGTTLRREPTDAQSSDRSTAHTVARMEQIIARSAQHPVVLGAARQIAAGLPANASDDQKARAVFAWVKNRVTFTLDETILRLQLGEHPNKELLIEPPRLLTMQQPMGDCDDYTMLVCSLLLALGVPCEMITVAADQQNPERWSHVYAQSIHTDGAKLALDASHGPFPGWEAPKVYRRQAWPIRYVAGTNSTGLNGIEAGRVATPARSRTTPEESQVLHALPPVPIKQGPNDPRTISDGQVLHGKPVGGFAGLGSTWGDVLKQGATTGFDILSNRFSHPKGTFIQTGADGSSTFFRQQPGSGFTFPTTQIGPQAGGDILLIGGLALAGLLLISAIR